MSHIPRPHRRRPLRDGQRLRKLAFETLEDRQVLSAIYGPEPPKVWASDVPGQCWSLAANAPAGSQPSLVPCGLDDARLDSMARRSTIQSLYRVASFDSTLEMNYSGLSADFAFSGNVVTPQGSGVLSLGDDRAEVKNGLQYQPASLPSAVVTDVSPVSTPSPIQPAPIQNSPAVTLGNPADVAKSSPPPESIFRPERVAAPMVWTVSPDAAQAIQRRYVVGSADVLSYGPSRSGQSLLTASSDVARGKKSNSGSDRGSSLLFDQSTGPTPLEAETRADAVFALSRSTRSWSRLAAGILRAPGSDDLDERIDIASIASPTSAEATEIARDLIFANMASSEEKLPPPPNAAATEPNRNTAAE